MTKAELNNCDTEPIHIPGMIQSHGFLIVINEQFVISHASQNVARFLGKDAIDLLGKHIREISDLLGKNHHSEFIVSIIDSAETYRGFDPNNPFVVALDNEEWLLAIHKTSQGYLLDFEREVADLDKDVQQFLAKSLSQILANKSLHDILENSSSQIRHIINYERVMIYKFHEDGHGEVVAESKSDELETWLGLHYPASDIPQQARALYKSNLVRLISDVHVEPSAVITHVQEPLDLSSSTLRAVSPIHIQYLKNMGVASSFSVSIICGNELWGLIACHNYTPRFINFRQRQSAGLLGQVLSSAIDLREQEFKQSLHQTRQRALDALIRYLSRNMDLQDALFQQESTLLNIIPSTGAVFLFENQLYSAGVVPDERFLKSFCSWLSLNMNNEVLYTDSLGTLFPSAKDMGKIAAGVLVCRLAKGLNEFIIWFRPEINTIVKWAGKPEKIQEIGENGLPYISPRKSFEIWSEMVQNKGQQWSESEVNYALLIRDEINYSISRKAMELRVLNEKLMEAYQELDSFAHTISHDLKVPLTAIKGYAQLLSANESIDTMHRALSGNIEKSVGKMTKMIEEILAYSRVGQYKPNPEMIQMAELLNEISTEACFDNANGNLVVDIGHTPDLISDRTMISQVFTNLISNAIKYSSRKEHPKVVISGEAFAEYVIYTISDNGIGIKEEDFDHIFDLFSRSFNAGSFKGTGVGLSIVKRIIEKQNGEIWLESELGEGSTFFVKFQKPLENRIRI